MEDKFGKSGGNPLIDGKFDKDMSEDFNTALALSELFPLFKGIAKKLAAGDASCAADVAQIRKTYSLLGLFKRDADEYLKEAAAKDPASGGATAEVQKLAEERWQAKLARNWAAADALRARINELGYEVKDSKEGYTISKK